METLGRPLTGRDDEDGAGIGVSGGAGDLTSTNTQAGMMAAEERSGFNAGVGGAHASGGIPHFHQQIPQDQSSNTPIADKFMSGGGATGLGAGAGIGGGAAGLTGDKLDNSLDNYGGTASGQDVTTGYGGDNLNSSNQMGGGNYGGGQPVSGAYEGGAADALTGQSRAVETGPGVGYGGSNLQSSTNDAALAAGAGGGAAGLAAGAGAGAYGSGVGAQGGAGGHYTDNNNGTGTGGGAGSTTDSGLDTGAGGAAQGHYGTTEKGFDRGAPISDPKDMDTGGPHSLVLDPATGKYIHRHEREGGALQDEK